MICTYAGFQAQNSCLPDVKLPKILAARNAEAVRRACFRCERLALSVAPICQGLLTSEDPEMTSHLV